MIEIERKFLVTSNAFKNEAINWYDIKQGFLNHDPERTVRVRIKNNKGVLTIKGKSTESGLSRFEWEKDIAKVDAETLLLLCEKHNIEKTRYEVQVGQHLFEIDVFHADNQGLIIAELELTSEDERFIKPNWLGKEVTGNVRYYNSTLSIYPYNKWHSEESGG